MMRILGSDFIVYSHHHRTLIMVITVLVLSLLLPSCGNSKPAVNTENFSEIVGTTVGIPVETTSTHTSTTISETIAETSSDENATVTTAQTSTTNETKPTETDIYITTQPTTSVAATTEQPQAVLPTAAPKQEGTYVICIDPGHQEKGISGTEPIAPGSTVMKAKVSSGTRGTTTGVPEYQLVLIIGLQLRDLLEAAGVTVIMTRETHDVRTSNVERAEMANAAGADLFIRIHLDGSEKSSVSGMSMLIPGNTYIKDEVLLAKSKTAGETILAEVIAATGAKNRGLVERSDMTGFNWSAVPVVLIEAGFMTNPDEDRLLNTPDYQKSIATGLFNGIVKWLAEQ